MFLRSRRLPITATRGYRDEAKERKRFREQLQLDHTRIIEHDGYPIGFFMNLECKHSLELHTLSIAPECPGRGIGTAGIRQIMGSGKDQGRQVLLSVLKPNRAARALHERRGFVVAADAGRHYQMRLVS